MMSLVFIIALSGKYIHNTYVLVIVYGSGAVEVWMGNTQLLQGYAKGKVSIEGS